MIRHYLKSKLASVHPNKFAMKRNGEEGKGVSKKLECCCCKFLIFSASTRVCYELKNFIIRQGVKVKRRGRETKIRNRKKELTISLEK